MAVSLVSAAEGSLTPGLSAGAIAGIVIGVLLVVGVAVGVAVYFMKKKGCVKKTTFCCKITFHSEMRQFEIRLFYLVINKE